MEFADLNFYISISRKIYFCKFNRNQLQHVIYYECRIYNNFTIIILKILGVNSFLFVYGQSVSD